MHDKKALIPVLFLLAALFYIFTTFEWLYYNEIIIRSAPNRIAAGFLNLYDKLLKSEIMIRLATCVFMALAFWVMPNHKMNKDEEEDNRMWVHITTLTLVGLYVMGFKAHPIYSIFIFPIITFASMYFILKSVSSLNKLVDKSFKHEISCLPANDMSLDFVTDKGIMRIHSPQQGIYVEGGAGAGKSFNVIEPLIFEAILKGYAGYVYDFKGNPSTLGKTVYSSLIYKEKNYSGNEPKIKTAFINFVDLSRTVRVNPLSPKYLTSDLAVTDISTTLMLNLNKDWITKKDFWAENAISLLDATIKYMKKHHPDKCTLPHVVSIILSNYEGLLNLLGSDEYVRRYVLPVIIAHEKDASGQITGAISSVQLPLTKLMNPDIFWVLSADDFSLDITNKADPKFLCVANDPRLQEALSPCIALITSIVMQQMNQQNKNKSVFIVDELPTIFIHKLDNLPATARSNKVVTVLSVQSYAQLERDYSKQNAEVIVGNLGNQFFGMTNEIRTAEKVVKMFGDHKLQNYSMSESDSGLSETHSYQKENVFQARDIMGLKIGRMVGKIAGGEPPLFSITLPGPEKRRYDKVKVLDIPSFSFPKECGSEEANKEFLQKLVDANFKKINDEAAAILRPFMPAPEEIDG